MNLHICACLCQRADACLSLPVCPGVVNDALCVEILQISELDATVEAKKQQQEKKKPHKTSQHYLPLISNLHKNLSVWQCQCGGLYFSLWCKPCSSK